MSTNEQRPGDRENGNGVDRDDLEGTYTEVDGEGPIERTVHGQYTEEEGVGPDPETKGSYTDTDEVSEATTEEEQGDYTERDR